MNQFKVGSVPEHFMLPWHLAIENRDFHSRDLSVEWQDYPGGTGAMMTDLHSGNLDIAIALTEGVVADIIKQRASKIVQVYIRSPLTWGIHVAANSPFDSVNELEGKSFAISRMGSGSHLMAIVMAKQLGWPLDTIPLEIVGGMVGARKALLKGEADAFMWEKYMTQPIVERGEFRRIGAFDTPWPCFVVVVRDELLQQVPAQIKSIMEIVQKSSTSFVNNPNAVALVSKRYHIATEDAKNWFKRTQWQTDFRISRAMLDEVMEALVSCQISNRKIDSTLLCSSLTELIE